ncbi:MULTISPECIES: pyridoxal phosphate-dependent decarboxylase family protein [Rahnella]|jgi:glutamate/tyrosine decarboxylase-like PLP-dependent enzyme|uniref:pyridoxal phosphate-dependent decarboxylase family protein n=1 Tax=Rahnella TaxID=34037 RepID=UPI002168AC11|nr:pyridoxal-dependent decarboxylase [Rahnella sp. BIGb0603]MCS3422483.1 glutamate/tyrosine decarboxylase-like PLP-dependent enzyme [Rahnella sp. BIGb0603]
MHPLLQHDLDTLPEILRQACDTAVSFLETLPERSTCPPASAQNLQDEDDRLPESGIGAQAALTHFWNRYASGMSASAGPRYFGFVTGGGTPAALAADWLVSTVDQNAQLNFDTIAPAIELATVAQLKQLFGLPESLCGTFVSGATMANFVSMAIARQWLGEQRGIDVAQQGLAALGPVRVLSASAHSSSVKALSMLGLGRDALVSVATLPGTEAIDPAALEQILLSAPSVPTMVLASAGTVNTVAFDDLPALLKLREKYDFWLHVDAAFGGVAAASKRYAPLLAGWEQADSVTIDAHKWLNVPYDSALQFTQQKHLALQVQVFQNHSPYLALPAVRPDNYLHLTPENSRRFRALPVWMALKAYGRDGLAEVVDRNVALARLLGEQLTNTPGFTLLAPVNLNVVCFALDTTDSTPRALEQRNQFLKLLDNAGVVRCTATSLNGKPGMRAALVNWMTRESDIRLALDSLKACRAEV